MLHTANYQNSTVINTDQISAIGYGQAMFNVCPNSTQIRFYNGDSLCVTETPEEIMHAIKGDN